MPCSRSSSSLASVNSSLHCRKDFASRLVDDIASELFGHERGSFTGAVERKEGKFELAEGGTMFLDEISTMDERTQINLLRSSRPSRYMRVGGKKERRANVRVVAATNRDLEQMVRAGQFREDLFYRLNICTITLPPLRERREDIAAAGRRVRRAQFAAQYHKPVQVDPGGDPAAAGGLHWPGNVRELRNVIEQAVLLARGPTLDPELLPQMMHRAGPPRGGHPHPARLRPCARPSARSSCARWRRTRATRRRPPRCWASAGDRSTTSWPSTHREQAEGAASL